MYDERVSSSAVGVTVHVDRPAV